MLKIFLGLRKCHRIPQRSGCGGKVNDLVHRDAPELRSAQLQIFLRGDRQILQIFKCLYRIRIYLVLREHLPIVWRMIHQILNSFP